MSSALSLGAPGIYEIPEAPLRALTGVRMDVCAFLGVSPRGPAREAVADDEWLDAEGAPESDRPRRRSVPIAVESWDDYVRLYGSFEGAGRLPYAVSSFFEQGGTRAYIVRIVHDFGDPLAAVGVASGELAGVRLPGGLPLVFLARNEGTWGNRLRAKLSFSARPLAIDAASTDELTLGPDVRLPAGALVRLRLPGGVQVLRFVSSTRRAGLPDRPEYRIFATLDFPVPAVPDAAEIVEGSLEVDDGEGRSEIHDGLGLSSLHPRWLFGVTRVESELVYPNPSWADLDVLPLNATLPAAGVDRFTGGQDLAATITPDDFFDAGWVLGDEPGAGAHALIGLEDLSLVVAPDLYSPVAVEPVEHVCTVSLAEATFERCVELPECEQEPPAAPLFGLELDPTIPADLERIVGYQSRLVDLADVLESFVVLLDVPPGLHQRQILRWRSRFSSDYAAGYHPWVDVTRTADVPLSPILLNPAAAAAGIVARKEHASGVPYGPSNELTAGAVGVAERVPPAAHDELHQSGVNVYLQERDGIRLTAARTLSLGRDYRQLSVRRLVTMLRRTLEQQMQWVAFEPNNAALRAKVRMLLIVFLRGLYRANAFEGATEDEAFFVRCDDVLNSRAVLDAGQLLVEVGVAPASPLEFIVLRIARDGDGTLRVEGPNG